MKKLRIDIAKLEIRKASTNDVEEIISLLNKAAEWIQSKGIDQWEPGSFDRRELLDRIREGEVYVAILQQAIVGTFTLQMHDKSVWGDLDSNEDFAYVHRLAINNDFRGQGLGLYLLGQAEKIAKGMAKKGVRLDCVSGNSILKNYYKSVAGYAPVKIAKMTDYDAQLFEKRFTDLG
jgi:N-acetylglutamate synthase-like GNAT family acetyltransferase